jgi:hypothetical protein
MIIRENEFYKIKTEGWLHFKEKVDKKFFKDLIKKLNIEIKKYTDNFYFLDVSYRNSKSDKSYFKLTISFNDNDNLNTVYEKIKHFFNKNTEFNFYN